MINQIKQALEKATPGPWLNRQAINNEYRVIEGDDQNINVASLLRNVHDAHLIANTPEWLRYLIGEVERFKGLYNDQITANVERINILVDKTNQVGELQKALEYIADEDNAFENLTLYAQKSLERSEQK